MSEDKFQRQMEFILDQQAKFEVSIAKLEENLARHEQENREMFAKLGDIILSLANHAQEQDEQIAALIEAGKETDRRFKETDERFRETDERMRETDERINALVWWSNGSSIRTGSERHKRNKYEH